MVRLGARNGMLSRSAQFFACARGWIPQRYPANAQTDPGDGGYLWTAPHG